MEDQPLRRGVGPQRRSSSGQGRQFALDLDNHLHFLVEAEYRYNAKAITNPRQMRNALAYVLNNWRRHREDLRSDAAGRACLDPYSTAIHFAGWREAARFAVPDGYEPLPSAEPETWLPRVGWQRHGPISVYEVPGALA